MGRYPSLYVAFFIVLSIVLFPQFLVASPGTYHMHHVISGGSNSPTEFGIPQSWTELQIDAHMPGDIGYYVKRLQLWGNGTGAIASAQQEPYDNFRVWHDILSWRTLPNGYVLVERKSRITEQTLIAFHSKLPTEVGETRLVIVTHARPHNFEDRVGFYGEQGISVLSETGIANFSIYQAVRIE